MRQRRGHAGEHHRGLAADGGDHAGRAAFVRHVHHVDTRHHFEHFRRQMRRAAVARRRITQLAGFGFRHRDHIRYGFCRHRRMHHQHAGGIGEVHHRREILDWVVGNFAVETAVDGHRAGAARHQRVAIGRRLRHHFGADDAVGARPVVHHHRLAECLAQFLSNRTRQNIRGTARGLRHDEADGFGGIALSRADRGGHHAARQ